MSRAMALASLHVWEISAAANAVIAACYFGIVWVIVGGLIRTGQTRSNALGVATGAIFFTCAVHHGAHTVHMLLPLVASDAHGLALRHAFGWQMAAWDIVGAATGIVYLSLRSSFGRLLQTPSMFRDMSQARVDEAIAAERAALNEAQAIGQMGSWRNDLISGEWETSAEFRRIFELPAGGDPSGRRAAVHPDDASALQDAIDHARQGLPGEATYRMTRGDGSEALLHVRARAEHGPDGSIVAVGGTVQDLTERAAMEAAVRDAEQRFSTAFAAAPIGMCLMSLQPVGLGEIVSANPAMERMLGHPVAELVQTSLASITGPEDHAVIAEGLEALAAGAQDEIELEARMMAKGGQLVWALITAAALPAGPSEPRLVVMSIMDVSQRKRFEGQLQYLADHDALTGLFNRRRFAEELERALKHAQRYRDAGAVLFVDLDGFKFVNDSLGHAVGDDLIARVGGMFASAVRETDVLARVGGDEFALILPRTDEAGAVLVAEKLLTLIRREGVAVSDDRHAHVSASIGITSFQPDDDTSADELLIEADVAMYDAKESGRDRYCIFVREDAHRALISVREDWNQRLSEAVDHGGFVLHAQPIIALSASTPPSFELLLRLPDEHGDLIPPGTFLHNAERFGLITRIDQWVLARAIALLSESHAAGFDLALSVNVSGRTITDPSLASVVAKQLAEHHVIPGRLTIEITETTAITNIERARTLASELRSLGCRIALDDFGAGFASFYYLKHLAFDELKIDGEFIRKLCSTHSDQLVVKAVVDIARGLNARTTAEFVGDDETITMLRKLGVDAAQGYHLGRPQALELVLPHLRDTRSRPLQSPLPGA
jgi:diguanylate cyclase (GGDEF)-like protein/PAS domain S-box-containing protein